MHDCPRVNRTRNRPFNREIMSQQHHLTPPEDRVPFFQKFGYGMGASITVVAVNAVPILMPVYHVDLLKISPVLIGFIAFLPRFWDAITDPIVGNISDNTRSRYGRRLPYIFIGGIIVGISFAMLFLVPEAWSQWFMFSYLLAISLVFYTGITLFMVPHGALGLEMSDDYHERNRIFAYFAFFGNVAGFILPTIYFLANRSFFSGPVQGMKVVCSIFGLLFFISALICVLLCKEKKQELVEKQEKINLWESFLTTCKNHTFVMLVVAFCLVILGFHIVNGFNSLIMIYYVFSGDKDAASKYMMYNGWIWSAVSLLGIPLMPTISRLIGKNRTVITAFAVIAIGNLAKIYCYNQAYPWLTFFPTICLSFGMVICFSIVYSMTADVCDEDELKTGTRREGMYFAIYGWWTKLIMSFAALSCGILLDRTGYDADLPQQTESALFWLRAWEIGLPVILCGIAIVVISSYPYTETRAYEVKELLKQRRAESS